MTIRLPASPTGDQYEDALAAALRTLGYFTETRIVLDDGGQHVLELDCVATPSGPQFAQRILLEAKTKSLSFADVFKLYGQRMYLGIPEARLVHGVPCEDRTAIVLGRVTAETAVTPVHWVFDPATLTTVAPACTSPDDDTRRALLVAGWWQAIAHRRAFAAFQHHLKSNGEDALCHRAREYYLATQQSFFVRKPLQRVDSLYQAYRDSPRLTGDFVSALGGNADITYRSLENTPDRLWLQYVMLLEHRARFAIIKHALERVLIGENDPMEITTLSGTTFVMDWERSLETMLPSAFRAGMRRIKDNPNNVRIPYLFQLLLESFGGFLFPNDPRELDSFAALSGIPRDDIVPTLYLLDEFFPHPNGSWFYTQKANLLRMKLVPAFLLGGGCFLREQLYSLKNYDELSSDMGWLLSKWHNALYATLEPELGVATTE